MSITANVCCRFAAACVVVSRVRVLRAVLGSDAELISHDGQLSFEFRADVSS